MARNKLAEFDQYFADYTDTALSNDDYHCPFVQELLAVDIPDLIALMQLAQSQLLINTIARRMAELVEECQNPQQVRDLFNLNNDLTAEEQETVRKEYGILNDQNN